MPETVAIHHPRDPTRPTLIPADRYDPDQHHIWNPNNPAEDPNGHSPSATESDKERPHEEEGERADQEVSGLPAGYWTERRGSYYTVFAPDGELVDKVHGKEAALELARDHGGARADS